jgi:hypothetical protein
MKFPFGVRIGKRTASALQVNQEYMNCYQNLFS